jgi:hypothetical protein
MVECQKTKVKVVPEALGRCSVTGLNVRKSLLSKSDVSGKVCLKSLLHSCEATGKLLLESELGKCQKSGRSVDLRLLRKCSVTGMLACKDEMVKSSLTGKWFLPEYVLKLPSGAQVAKNEVVICSWTHKYTDIRNAATCKICGLIFSHELINTSGEFKLLRDCLDGRIEGHDFPDPLLLARAKPNVFGGINSFRWLSSESGRIHIMFGKKSFYGMSVKHFAVMATGNMLGFYLVGIAVMGKRVKGVWQMTESHRMN